MKVLKIEYMGHLSYVKYLDLIPLQSTSVME